MALVVAIWLAAGGFLYVLTNKRHPHTTINPTIAQSLQSVSIEKNRLGYCWFGISDPNGQQPLCEVSFDNLQTSSATAGPFKTAALRSMDIQQLKIDLLSGPSSLVSNDIGGFAQTASISAHQPWYEVLIQKLYLQSSVDNHQMRIPLPDFSHLVQIRITDFQCRFFEGQNIALDIRSKRASVETDRTAELLLRGHVIIRSPAAVLECNRVRWDIQNQIFTAHGFYTIRKANDLEKGYDGNFDGSLNIISQPKTLAYKGEKTK